MKKMMLLILMMIVKRMKMNKWRNKVMIRILVVNENQIFQKMILKI